MTPKVPERSLSRKQYAIMRIGKLKDFPELCEAMRHNTRNQQVSFTDANRPGPVELLPGAKGTIEARAKAVLEAKKIKSVEGKNLAVELLCTASPGWWQQAKEDQKREFIIQSYRFVKDKLGDGLISCMVHLDEGTPHIHAIGLPIYQKKRGIRGAKPTTKEGVAKRVAALKAQPIVWMLSYDKVISGSSRAFADHQTQFHQYVHHLGLARGEDTVGQYKHHNSLKSYRRELHERQLELDERDKMLSDRHRAQNEIQALIDHDARDQQRRSDVLMAREQQMDVREEKVERQELRSRSDKEEIDAQRRQLGFDRDRLEEQSRVRESAAADRERRNELIGEVLKHVLDGTAEATVVAGHDIVDVTGPAIDDKQQNEAMGRWPKWAIKAAELVKKLLERLRGIEDREKAADERERTLDQRDARITDLAGALKIQEDDIATKLTEVRSLEQALPDARSELVAIKQEVSAKEKQLAGINQTLHEKQAVQASLTQTAEDIVKAKATLAEQRVKIVDQERQIANHGASMYRQAEAQAAAEAAARAAICRRDAAIAERDEAIRKAANDRQGDIDAEVARRTALAEEQTRARLAAQDRAHQDNQMRSRREAADLEASIVEKRAERASLDAGLLHLRTQKQQLEAEIIQHGRVASQIAAERVDVDAAKKVLEGDRKKLDADRTKHAEALRLMAEMTEPGTTVTVTARAILLNYAKDEKSVAIFKEDYPAWLSKAAEQVVAMQKVTKEAGEAVAKFAAVHEKVEPFLPKDDPVAIEAEKAALAARRLIESQKGQGW